MGALGLGLSAGGSFLGGAIGGSGVPTYEPSPLMTALEDYGMQQVVAPKSTRKAIKAEAKTYTDPGSREAYLQSLAGRYSNSKFIDKALRRSYKQPIDWEGGPYREFASQAYGEQGLNLPESDFQNLINIAKSQNIRSPQAFSTEVRRSLLASGKAKTPYDIAWESQYGNMQRNPDGTLRRGMVNFDLAKAKEISQSMLGSVLGTT